LKLNYVAMSVGATIYYDELPKFNFFENFVVLNPVVIEEHSFVKNRTSKEIENSRRACKRMIRYKKILTKHFLTDEEKLIFDAMLTKNRPERFLVEDFGLSSRHVARRKMKAITAILNICYDYFSTTDYKKAFMFLCRMFPLKTVSTVIVWMGNRNYGKTAILERCSISTVSIRINEVIKRLCESENDILRKTGNFIRSLKSYVHH